MGARRGDASGIDPPSGEATGRRLSAPAPAPADDWDGFAATRFVQDTKVVEGLDGFLFMADDNNNVLAQHSGKLRLDAQQLDGWRQVLEHRTSMLARRGCSHFVMVAPNTHSVYPEKLPAQVAAAAKERPVHQLMRHLAEAHSPVSLIYPLDELLAAKPARLVCARTDSHWTDYGAFLAYSSLIRRAREVARTRALELHDLLFIDIDVAGDLGFKYTPPRTAPQPFARLRYRNARLVYDNTVEGTGCLAVTDCDVAPATTCLLLGDSYGYVFAKFLSESFHRLVFAHAPTLDTALVEAVAPDIVVTLIAERFLVSVPDDRGGPSMGERERRKRESERARPPLQYWTWPMLVSPGPVELMRARLLAEDRAMEAVLVSVMAYAGLRPAEAMALRWSDVERDAIVVRPLPGPRATGRSARHVPLWRPLADDLDAWRRTSAGSGDELVFVKDGQPFDLRAWRETTYDRLSSEAGLANRRPAFLRHVFCVLLINAGASLDEVAELVDMDSAELVENFRGLWDDSRRGEPLPPEQSIARARGRIAD